MEIFDLRDDLIGDYESFVRSFLQFRDWRIEQRVNEELQGGKLWLEPRIGLLSFIHIGRRSRATQGRARGRP